MGKPATIQQSGADQERQQIANSILTDWKQRWSPVLKTFSENTLKALEPGSAERQWAKGLAGTDVSVAYGNAQQQALDQAAKTGTIGSARQKLGVVGLGDKQTTTGALVANDAEQSVTDAGVSGLQTLVSQGQGIKSNAVGGFNTLAATGEAQTRQDAELKQEHRAGNAQMIGSLAGMGLGTWAGMSGTPADTGFGSVPGGYVDPNTGATLNNPSAWINPRG